MDISCFFRIIMLHWQSSITQKSDTNSTNAFPLFVLTLCEVPHTAGRQSSCCTRRPQQDKLGCAPRNTQLLHFLWMHMGFGQPKHKLGRAPRNRTRSLSLAAVELRSNSYLRFDSHFSLKKKTFALSLLFKRIQTYSNYSPDSKADFYL